MSENRTAIHTTTKLFPYSTEWFKIPGLTVQYMIRHNIEKYKDRDFLGAREYNPETKKYGDYKYIKYGEVGQIITDLGSGFRAIGLDTQDKFGIISKNCLEWSLSDYASACQNLVLIPVYESSGPAEYEYVIVHSEIRGIICHPDKLEIISNIKKSGVSKFFEYIIVIDKEKDPSAPVPEGATHTFSQILELGKAKPHPDVIANPDDLYSIVYTSGTTGQPKGVLLTHQNVAAGSQQLTPLFTVDPNYQDYFISYLPNAHIFGRVVEQTMASFGCAIGYFTGSMPDIIKDIQALRPTLLPGVPRIYAKTYQNIKKTVDAFPFYKRWMFNIAYKAKLAALRKRQPCQWADSIVFNKIKAIMGGRCRLIFNGSAVLPVHISEFISTCFGVIVGEGYGLTETGSTCCCRQETAFDGPNCGIPDILVEVCLESVPDMGYLVTDKPYPQGEILIRGPNVFKGYYKDPDATAAVLGPDGWFHSGDIGAWVPGPYFADDNTTLQDSLRIIDRKKNIFKLNNGEYVCAERVESILLQYCSYIKQIVVTGNTTSSLVLAVVVPEWDLLLDKTHKITTGSEKWTGVSKYWADEEARVKAGTPLPEAEVQPGAETRTPLSVRNALKEEQGLITFLVKSLNEAADKACVESKDVIKRYEVPKGVLISAEEWTQENKCATPSLKVRREAVRQLNRDAIEAKLLKLEEEAAAAKKD